MPQRSKPRVVPPVLPSESPVDSWLRGIRLSGFSILVLALVILSIVVLAPSLRMLVEQRQQVAELQSSLERQKQTVADLTQQRARWDDPAYIKAQARDRLFYVMPGEYAYLIIDNAASGAAADPKPASTRIEETKVDWASSLLSSYFRAGLSEAPVAGAK
jgi:cell division protein FtsB